jgi:hypothetical protein
VLVLFQRISFKLKSFLSFFLFLIKINYWKRDAAPVEERDASFVYEKRDADPGTFSWGKRDADPDLLMM